MKEFKYTITDPEGIHARPAGELVKVCKEFACKITLTKDGKTADCKKIFGLMGLAVKKEQEVVVTFDVVVSDDVSASLPQPAKAVTDIAAIIAIIKIFFFIIYICPFILKKLFLLFCIL